MRYTTAETKNLSYDGIIDLADSSFTTTLEGKGITTFISTEVSSGIKPLFSSVPQNYPNPFNPVPHTVRFDGANLTSGIYFYKLQAADQVITRKMMFIK